MDLGKLNYLLISRYITYMLTYIGSIIIIGNNIKSVVIFTLLFIVVLITSSLRIYKFSDRIYLFIISILIELVLISFMHSYFCHLTFLFIFILFVDIFLFLDLKTCILVSLPAYITISLLTYIESKQLQIQAIFSDILSYWLALTFFAAVSYGLKNSILMKDKIQILYSELKESKEDLESANKKLKYYSENVEEISILNERNRLAGEIHDTIGHNLTSLIIEIDICNKLIDKDIDKTKIELNKAQKLARYSLSEVRKSVRSIKSSNNLTGLNAIKNLIRCYEKNTGIVVHFNTSKRQYRLSPTIEVTVYSAIQESLTNCAKYGNANNAYIDIYFKENGIEFFIKNDGLSCHNIKKGVGLTTMQERVEVLGGNLKISGENNFNVSGFIPMEV
ncbi:sensor histidine kinase [Clostridium estertheticum]|uniref:sensor histidine kinase n=1 Tax=Clostridium estertheticum TaxID=238834 RepID=UPI001C6E7AF5|nr:sensor histidine kinase [Clostridium estertheticum]MBW9154574.1 sensor histidine kinase [Clostridium estertheticum]WLC83815.1 sensor histidine kinase [Clostridium estertheticum]